MQAWCQQLLSILEGGDPLDDLARSALLTARAYVDAPTADRIDALLGQNEPESNEDAGPRKTTFSAKTTLSLKWLQMIHQTTYSKRRTSILRRHLLDALSQQSPESPESSSSFPEGMP